VAELGVGRHWCRLGVAGGVGCGDGGRGLERVGAGTEGQGEGWVAKAGKVRLAGVGGLWG